MGQDLLPHDNDRQPTGNEAYHNSSDLHQVHIFVYLDIFFSMNINDV